MTANLLASIATFVFLGAANAGCVNGTPSDSTDASAAEDLTPIFSS